MTLGEGWTVRESKSLLDFLYQHASRPEFQTRFRWQEGSIAFWDNRATWHYALNDYQGERRLMPRLPPKACRCSRRISAAQNCAH
jgi:taurine dioxygenase